MFNVILVAPEIPPNTGNVIRLCANTGARLHLVEPLGFELSEYQLRRAGMDYAEIASVTLHADWQACLQMVGGTRLFALTTKGARRPSDTAFQNNDSFVFGSESKGLPQEVFADIPEHQHLRLPLMPGNRSLNLSNAVAVLVYEAWRQHDFSGGR